MTARSFLAPALAAASLAGCAAPPAPQIATPTPELPDQFMFAAAAEAEAALHHLLPSDDPAFTRLASKALENSPSLLEAMARVDAARANAARAGAQSLPAIGANGSVTASRTNPAQFGVRIPGGIGFDTDRTAYAANLTARWEIDLFGRLRARERGALARLDAASAEARAARLALLAEIAASVIDWRTLEARMDELRSDVEAAEELARLAAIRERAGIAPGFDRVRAQSAANASRSRLAILASERNRLAGRLVALTARPMHEVLTILQQQATQAGLPPAPPAAPSMLLTNRPDVLAAAARLRAADADLAATARQRFPDFDLSAALGLLAFDASELFDGDSLVHSLAASIAAPLLDFGRLAAEIDRAAADKQAAFQAFRGVVWTALGDAEAAYGLVASTDAEYRAALADAQSARRAAELAESRYRAGLADFLTTLEARRAADASGERAAAALGRAKRARVLLWQALGGTPAQPTSRSTNQ